MRTVAATIVCAALARAPGCGQPPSPGPQGPSVLNALELADLYLDCLEPDGRERFLALVRLGGLRAAAAGAPVPLGVRLGPDEILVLRYPESDPSGSVEYREARFCRFGSMTVSESEWKAYCAWAREVTARLQEAGEGRRPAPIDLSRRPQFLAASPWRHDLPYPRLARLFDCIWRFPHWPAMAPRRRPARLSQVVLPKLEFPEIALADALQFFEDVSGIEFRVDWAALAKAGVPTDAKVSVKLKDTSLELALVAVLDSVAPRLLGFEESVSVRVSTRAALRAPAGGGP